MHFRMEIFLQLEIRNSQLGHLARYSELDFTHLSSVTPGPPSHNQHPPVGFLAHVPGTALPH